MPEAPQTFSQSRSESTHSVSARLRLHFLEEMHPLQALLDLVKIVIEQLRFIDAHAKSVRNEVTPVSWPLWQRRCTSALWVHIAILKETGGRPNSKSAQAVIAFSVPLHTSPARTMGTRSVLASSSSSCIVLRSVLLRLT